MKVAPPESGREGGREARHPPGTLVPFEVLPTLGVLFPTSSCRVETAASISLSLVSSRPSKCCNSAMETTTDVGLAQEHHEHQAEPHTNSTKGVVETPYWLLALVYNWSFQCLMVQEYGCSAKYQCVRHALVGPVAFAPLPTVSSRLSKHCTSAMETTGGWG